MQYGEPLIYSGRIDRWAQSGDTAIRQRILDYSEDDCRATRVLLARIIHAGGMI